MKSFNVRFLLTFWFPVVLYSGIIFYMSSLSQVDVPLSGFNFDKIVHIVEYIPFGVLLVRALGKTNNRLSIKMLIGLTFVLSLMYGVSDEYHQSFIVGRDANLMDVVADSIGGMIGGFFYTSFIKIKS